LGAISSWLPLLAFTKFVELRFTVLISLYVLIDIKFFFKCRKETLWFHLEHLLYEILTPDSAFLNTFLNFLRLKFGVYTFILKKLSLKLVILFTDKILTLNFLHLEWMNSFILALVHECIPWTNVKNQPCVVSRCSIAARTPVKNLFHNELKKTII